MAERLRTHIVVAGGGPAGMALPIGAAARGRLPELVDKGLVIVEAGKTVGVGNIDKILSSSNSGAADFSQYANVGPFAEAVASPAGQALVRGGDRPVTNLRRDVAPFLEEIGNVVRRELRKSPQSGVRTEETVLFAQQTEDGTYLIPTSKGDVLETDVVVAATGAEEQIDQSLERHRANGTTVLVSGDVLSSEALEFIGDVIAEGGTVGFKGARHSSFSAARLVLDTYGHDIRPGQLVVVHRGPIKVFYGNTDEADAAGYAYDKRDIDRETGRVNRYPGIRHSSAGLYEDIAAGREDRVQLRYAPTDAEADKVFADAAALVQATGYNARVFEIRNQKGQIIGPLLGVDGHVLVTDDLQVLDFDGEPIPNFYAVGHGFSPIENGTRLDGINNYHQRGVTLFDRIMDMAPQT